MSQHDSNYKRLFSHPQMVESLLRDFVREDWVDKIDFDSLEKSNSSYVSDDLRDRHDDIIWKLNLDGQPVILYLLIEFQSTVDQHMALRVMTYLGLLYQDHLQVESKSNKNKNSTKAPNKAHKLPPVFPIVIYNGEIPWTAPRDVSELIHTIPGHLSQYVPHLKYYLLDESHEASKGNEHLQGLMGDIIRLESGDNPKSLEIAIAKLRGHLQGPNFDSLRRAFHIWIQRVLIQRVAKDDQPVEFNNLEEIQSMLEETVHRWTIEWKEEGRQEGQHEERELMLTKVLHKRLGDIPQDLQTLIKGASLEDLDRWFDLALDAKRLEDVF